MKDIATPVATEGPGQLSRIQQTIVDVGPKSAPEPGEAKPKMPDAVTTNRCKPSAINVGPVSECFHHDPKLFYCEKAQPR